MDFEKLASDAEQWLENLKDRPHLILMPGGSGAINPGEHGEIDGLKGNQLVRTRRAYAAHSVSIHAAGPILIS